MAILRTIFGRWEPHEAVKLVGISKDVSISIDRLECERNSKSGKIRLKGDCGACFVDWLDAIWKKEGRSPFRMHSGSPWNLRVDLKGIPPFNITIDYRSVSTESEMFEDTTDALIDALQKAEKDTSRV
jgi:hypothetical protein